MVKEGLILISYIPVTVIEEPLAVAIFCLLEHGEYERKSREEGVIVCGSGVNNPCVFKGCIKGI